MSNWGKPWTQEQIDRIRAKARQKRDAKRAAGQFSTIKRKPLRKSPRPGTTKYAKKQAWDAFSRYIRLRDCLKTTKTPTAGRCVTCNRSYPFTKLQAGHWLPGRRNSVLFDERGVAAQCVGCNVWGRGQQAAFEEYMRREHGEEVMAEIREANKTGVRFTKGELEEMRREYQAKYAGLLVKAAKERARK